MTRTSTAGRGRLGPLTALAVLVGLLAPAVAWLPAAPALADDSAPPTCAALPTDQLVDPTTCVPADTPPPAGGDVQVGDGVFSRYSIPLSGGGEKTGSYVEFPVVVPTIPTGCGYDVCGERVDSRLWEWSSRDGRFYEREGTTDDPYEGVGPYDCLHARDCTGPYWARLDTTYFGDDIDYYDSIGALPWYLMVEDVIAVKDGFDTVFHHQFRLVRIPWEERSTPTAAFTATNDTTTPGRVIVSSTSVDGSGNPTFDTWDFGDGSEPGTGRFTTHDYTEPGTYTITLTARADTGKTATTTQQVTIAAPTLSTSVEVVDASPPLALDAPVTVRVTASASADGVGELSDLTFGDATPLAVSPPSAFTLVSGPTPAAPDGAFALSPGQTRTWEYTLRTSATPVSRYVLSTSLSGEDAAGAAVTSESTSPGEIGQALRVELSVDPSAFTLEEDASGPKPRDVTVTETITNTTSQPMTDVVLRSLEPQRTSSGQPLAVVYKSGAIADPVDGTPLGDIPAHGSITLTAVYTVSDDGEVDFTSLVSATGGDGSPLTATGTARMDVGAKYVLRVESEVVTPQAGALLPAGSPIVIRGTVKNITGTSSAEVAPLYAQLTGNAGLQSFVWDATGADPKDLSPTGSLVIGPGESKDFTLKVLTSYSEAVVGASPLTHPPGSGGTSATVTFTPWATVTEEDGTVFVTDPAKDILTTAADLSHRVSIDDSIAIPEADGTAVGGGMLVGGIGGLWNAASGMVTGLIALPGAAGSSLYALSQYQAQVWDGFDEEQKRAFADDAAYLVASVLLANYDNAKVGAAALHKQAADAVYEYFTKAEVNWRVGDYASTVELYSSLASNGLAQVALPVAIGKLAKSATAVESLEAAQEARNARGAATVDALAEGATIEQTLPTLTSIESGTELSADQIRKLYGISADELARLQQLATERDIAVVVRSRAASSLDWIESGAMVKPEVLKIKSVSGLDVLLGYPEKYEGALVLKEPPPLAAFRANGGDLPSLVDSFVQSKGFTPGTSDYEAAILRVNDRIKEWNDYAATYQQWSKRGWIETSFNYSGNAMNNPASAVERGRYQGFHLAPTGADGEYVVQMLNGKLGRYVEVTGDIDPIAFTRTDGTPLSVEEHTSLLNAMSKDPLLRTQHGESTTFVKGGIAFIQKQFKPGEAALMIAPGGNPARAVRLNTSMSTWTSATDYRLIWDGGFVDAGVGPVSPATLVTDGAAVLGREPTPAPPTTVQAVPGGGTPSSPNLGRCSVTFKAGAPALAMAADGQVSEVDGTEIRTSAYASVCFSEGPVVEVTASPSTESTADAIAGQSELPVRDDEAVASVGEDGLQVGQTVIVDPGTDDAETGTISAFGSIILQSPLTRPHAAGAVIVVVGEPASRPDGPAPGAGGAGGAPRDGVTPTLPGAAPASSSSSLAATGSTIGLDSALIGALVVVLGLGLTTIGRRRLRARDDREAS